MLAYFPWFFGNRKKRLPALFELFKSTEYFETEDVTYNHKKKGKKKSKNKCKKTATYSNQLIIISAEGIDFFWMILRSAKSVLL